MGNAKLITYDLVKPETDYADLIDAIKKYPGWCNMQKSVWIVSSSDSCATIRDHLKRYTDSDDRLLVVALTGESAWTSSICDSDSAKRVITS
ncbi:hypothetical protein ACRQV7_02975 [Caproiciproducens sp. R2]|uniref:hypothetical protein n=1 Tax=Caproiciproducens sp. R2 TaxID=3435187 RepID=UPI004033E507